MKFTKIALAALMMAVTAGCVQAATVASSNMIIYITFTRSSCDIQVPPEYNLATLTPGVKEHENLKITWNCEGNTPVKTALTAAIVRGNANGNEKVTLLTDDGQATGVTLFLKEKAGSLIKLTGPGGGNYFCGDAKEATGMRTCTLTPVTDVSRQGGTGLVSATLRFEVEYP
ncbi:F18 fimbrial protein FedE [Escherichia albertii]|uniref:F18 fimbrial protein FedE n=1 Tax=Escherichia albertii TaxID=208962 RepID=UPI00244B7C5B|nr:F18 fimbrial protein FedE [Escherichia albertii]